MNKNILEQQLERLSDRLRILILQNSRYESDYDIPFLQEINHLSHKMLLLKAHLQKNKQVQAIPVKISDDISAL